MKRVLFVEDDALIARVYGQKLTEAGLDVAIAEDGLVAMKRLPEFKPDLVILDLMMPKLSGVDVLNFMRRSSSFKNTRVVVFSNSFVGGLIEQVAATGVDKVLIKSSATPMELVRIITGLLDSPAPPPRATPAAVAAPSLAPPTTGQPAPTSESDVESEFRSRMRRDFLASAPALLKSVRDLCLAFVETSDPASRAARLGDLNRKAHFLSHMAGMSGHAQVAQLASALEALAFELERQPGFVNESSCATVATATVRLSNLLARLDTAGEPALALPQILVVDDDLVASHALVLALAKAQLRATSVADPYEALKALEEKPFDLVFLDINMPGLDGVALCEQMRALPLHRQTPVVFVTSFTDLKARTRSALAGGNDYITKPILPAELCVKAIGHLMNRTPVPAAAPASPPVTGNA